MGTCCSDLHGICPFLFTITMHLLDIPPELFDQIILALARTVPRAELLGLRGVCRKFFSEFWRGHDTIRYSYTVDLGHICTTTVCVLSATCVVDWKIGAFARNIEYQAKRLPEEIKNRMEGRKMIEVGEEDFGAQNLHERTFGMQINCSRGWGMVLWREWKDNKDQDTDGWIISVNSLTQHKRGEETRGLVDWLVAMYVRCLGAKKEHVRRFEDPWAPRQSNRAYKLPCCPWHGWINLYLSGVRDISGSWEAICSEDSLTWGTGKAKSRAQWGLVTWSTRPALGIKAVYQLTRAHGLEPLHHHSLGRKMVGL